MCQAEFIAQSNEYYEQAIREGRICIHDKPVPLDYVLKHNDLICHRTVCAENPVSADPIRTILETDNLIAVSKPSSVAVHACGGYRLNTLVSILQTERGDAHELLPAHRIDRLTSGLVILGKSSETAREISACIADNGGATEVTKEYLALVKSSVLTETVVKGYIRCIDFRIGKFVISDEQTDDSKYSETIIVPVKHYADRNETLVRCRPITGRTHQIRLHLQFIGHPIVNDICYGGAFDADHPFAIPQIPSVQYDSCGKLFCGGIFLHAFRYRIPSMSLDLKADLPPWALDYTDSG